MCHPAERRSTFVRLIFFFFFSGGISTPIIFSYSLTAPDVIVYIENFAVLTFFF